MSAIRGAVICAFIADLLGYQYVTAINDIVTFKGVSVDIRDFQCVCRLIELIHLLRFLGIKKSQRKRVFLPTNRDDLKFGKLRVRVSNYSVFVVNQPELDANAVRLWKEFRDRLFYRSHKLLNNHLTKYGIAFMPGENVVRYINSEYYFRHLFHNTDNGLTAILFARELFLRYHCEQTYPDRYNIITIGNSEITIDMSGYSYHCFDENHTKRFRTLEELSIIAPVLKHYLRMPIKIAQQYVPGQEYEINDSFDPLG